ncbi:MAG: hypothetical protein GSR80_000616 [Desulfurococcales archaeon]|nr:hypothetical protein [Desulfurococcales archaeon]
MVRWYLCVNHLDPGAPALLVRASRAGWAKYRAAGYSGVELGWFCLRAKGVKAPRDAEVVPAEPGMVEGVAPAPFQPVYEDTRKIIEAVLGVTG